MILYQEMVCFLLQEDIRYAVKNMLRKFGTQRYIANLGHGMHPDHDLEKLATFIDTIHSYSETMNERKLSGDRHYNPES